MFHEYFFHTGGWVSLESFDPFQELYCFNQCLLDSAFTRTYHVYIGNGDIDTLEVYFAERTERYHLFFNGVDGAPPEETIGTTANSNLVSKETGIAD